MDTIKITWFFKIKRVSKVKMKKLRVIFLKKTLQWIFMKKIRGDNGDLGQASGKIRIYRLFRNSPPKGEYVLKLTKKFEKILKLLLTLLSLYQINSSQS